MEPGKVGLEVALSGKRGREDQESTSTRFLTLTQNLTEYAGTVRGTRVFAWMQVPQQQQQRHPLRTPQRREQGPGAPGGFAGEPRFQGYPVTAPGTEGGVDSSPVSFWSSVGRRAAPG